MLSLTVNNKQNLDRQPKSVCSGQHNLFAIGKDIQSMELKYFTTVNFIGLYVAVIEFKTFYFYIHYLYYIMYYIKLLKSPPL